MTREHQEFIKQLKEQKRKEEEERKIIREKVFGSTSIELSHTIRLTEDGDLYKIFPRFGTFYKDSRIRKINLDELYEFMKEDLEIKELAKAMAAGKG